MIVIAALGRLRQEDLQFEGSLSYTPLFQSVLLTPYLRLSEVHVTYSTAVMDEQLLTARHS